MAEPFVVEPVDGSDVGAFGADIILRGTPELTGGVVSLIDGTWQPGGFAPIPHVHQGEDETFYTLAGRFEFRIGDDRVVADPGTLVFVPRGILHGFRVAGDEPARLLAWHTPGIGQFFLDLAALGVEGPPDASTIAGLMRRWGMEVPREQLPG
jgi:quercetin dioxygenase-like cupin family protein